MTTVLNGLTGVRHHGQTAQVMQILLPAFLAVMLGAAIRLLNLEKRISFKIRREFLI
jgi:hypothetical protein